jgi:NADH-quinone oxidoreductase subunit J
MELVSALFYVFASLLVCSAFAVVIARHPVHAVLFLIFAFFNAAGLFLLAGAEFLALLLVIVYVGAVAVLFLFVVMMLDVDFVALRQGMRRFIPVAGGMALILLLEMILVLNAWPELAVHPRESPSPEGVSNAVALGRVLYDDYFLVFQGAGVILLIAMIGAIVLTVQPRKKQPKRQSIAQQNTRQVTDTLEIRNLSSGSGVDV